MLSTGEMWDRFLAKVKARFSRDKIFMDKHWQHIPIAAGRRFSLFLSKGDVRVKGNNANGELGIGADYLFAFKPIKLEVESRIVSVATGDFHTLLLDENGDVFTCGRTPNQNQQSIYYLEKMQGIPLMIAVFGGIQRAFLIDAEYNLWVMGDNCYSTLAMYDTYKPVPVQIAGPANIKQVSSGPYQTLFLDRDGTVWSCGEP